MKRLHHLLARRVVRIISLAVLIVSIAALVIVTNVARVTAHSGARSIPASQAAAIVKSGQARSIEVQLDRAYVRTDDAEYVFVKDREARLPVFRASLDPLRRTVERQEFVAGNAPAYADYVVFGAFQWARSISDFELLATDDPVRAWRSRMLDLFGGLARHAPGYGG